MLPIGQLYGIDQPLLVSAENCLHAVRGLAKSAVSRAPVSRLPPQPGERIDRSRELELTFDGKRIPAFEGDTIASALFASGRRVFSRSFKYHRPRGLLCCAGQCANCMVAVDGAPGVRACTEPVRAGMRVEHLNAWPSLERDVMRLADRIGGPFMPVGFYYKTFMRPRRLWPLYEKVLRRAAGLGCIAHRQPERRWRTDYRRRHADVLVVGAGAAGLSAALRAAELGADVVLVDEGPEPGGRLLVDGRHERARMLSDQVAAAGVEVLTHASAIGFFDGLVAVWQGDTLHQVRAPQHLVATGAIEQPLVFEGNDLPGVMLAGGARRLAALYALAPGARAVVATTDEAGVEAAVALRDAGVAIAAVADLRPDPPSSAARVRLEDDAVTLCDGATVVAAEGGDGVERAMLARIDAAGRPQPGSEHEAQCDLVLVSGGFTPASSLLYQAGGRGGYDARADALLPPDELPDGVHAAGSVLGSSDGADAEQSGSLAGAHAAHALGLGDEDSRRRAEEQGAALRLLRAGEARATAPPAAASHGSGKCFACLCEDVTTKEIAQSVAEGFDSIELSKRYTTVTMGPCQGRMCQLPSIRLMARETGRDLEAVGTTTGRPPWSTIPLGALAGRPIEPAKRSSIHALHHELGANVMWAGDWRRAYDYGDPAAEARAVHEAAGLIDVSTLGKLIVRGPDAGAFLDRLYPNRISNLDSGRIRYGVLGSDAGRIMDDGTICRLDEQSFYVTTTSSGAGAVEEWFSWWLADWRMDVHITDVTAALCALNLAGPQARAILAQVAELDCSNESFGYLDGRQARVAAVDCLILRIGFVGELGYEIHCPAAHGEHVWQAIMAAGAGRGIRPFDLEPQRVLRLEKLHILVGQDTDSESTPFGASMPWVVKLDKEGDFVGRWALTDAADAKLETALVGFRLSNGAVPTEGAAVIFDGDIAGRVTSARYSDAVGGAIGMAWVPAALAADGATITIADDGRRVEAEVTTRPFYDPDGERLRS